MLHQSDQRHVVCVCVCVFMFVCHASSHKLFFFFFFFQVWLKSVFVSRGFLTNINMTVTLRITSSFWPRGRARPLSPSISQDEVWSRHSQPLCQVWTWTLSLTATTVFEELVKRVKIQIWFISIINYCFNVSGFWTFDLSVDCTATCFVQGHMGI